MSNTPHILTRAIIAGQPHNQEFTKEAVMIGKGETNDLVFDVPGVSSVHAIIKLSGQTLTIQDLGSTNGTYVNGQRIEVPTVITPRDSIFIGQVEMRAKIKAPRQDVSAQPAVKVADAAPAPLPAESTPVVQEPPKGSAFANDDNDEDAAVQVAPAPVSPGPAKSVVDSKNIPRAQAVNTSDILSEEDKPKATNKVLEVSLFWGDQLMAVNHYNKGRSVFIGDNPKNDFKIEGAAAFGTDKFPFLIPTNDGFLLQITDAVDLVVKNSDGMVISNKDELLRLGQLVRNPAPAPKPIFGYAIKLEDYLTVSLGELSFVIRYVSPARWIPVGLSNSLDFFFSKIIGISLVVHLFLVLALLFTPRMPEGLNDELFQNPDRFANLIIQPPPVKKNKDEFKLEAKLEKARPQSTKTVEKERFGKVEEKKVVASGKKGPAVDLDKRERDQKRALNAGIFSALKGSKGAASVFSGGGLGSGINNAVATLQGPAQEDAGGMGGLGSRGHGGAYGGGGLGIGGLGSGVSGGGGGGSGVGLAGREKSSYTIASGRTRVEGGLSQAEVAKVLQRAQSQVRFCYEKELQKNPNLDGKIVTIFKIGPNGRVIQSSIGPESTLNDDNVKSCVLNVIKKLIFPQPRGGGVVDVNYPWLFKRSG